MPVTHTAGATGCGQWARYLRADAAAIARQRPPAPAIGPSHPQTPRGASIGRRGASENGVGLLHASFPNWKINYLAFQGGSSAELPRNSTIWHIWIICPRVRNNYHWISGSAPGIGQTDPLGCVLVPRRYGLANFPIIFDPTEGR